VLIENQDLTEGFSMNGIDVVKDQSVHHRALGNIFQIVEPTSAKFLNWSVEVQARETSMPLV